jgi:hypothetical protein
VSLENSPRREADTGPADLTRSFAPASAFLKPCLPMRLVAKPHYSPIVRRPGWRPGTRYSRPECHRPGNPCGSTGALWRQCSGRLHSPLHHRPSFPSDSIRSLELDLKFVDVPSIDRFDDQAGPVPFAFPSARDIRISLTGICEPRADYYGSEEIRRGIAPFMLNVRRESVSRA